MYFTSLSFYPADLLVAACTSCAGFDNSSGRRATRWSQLFFKLPPVSGLGYESDTRLNSSFPSNENWGSDGQGRKFVSCHRGWKTTLADKNVFFPSQIYLDMSYGRWRFNALKNKLVWFAKIWKPPMQDIGTFEDWQNFVHSGLCT